MAVFARLVAAGACALALVTWLAQPAQAQGRFDVEGFELAPLAPGSVLNVYGARTLRPLHGSLALFASYAESPLSIETTRGDHVGDLVSSVGSLQLLGAVGLFSHVDLGFALSLHRTGAGSAFGVPELDAASLPESQIAFGDVRVIPRVSLYEHSGESGFDVALLAQLWLPTGADSAYAGEPLRVEPRLAFDYQSRRFKVALNIGYMLRSRAQVVNTEANDQLRLGLGADVAIASGFHIQGTYDNRLNLRPGKFNDDDVDSELLFALRYLASGFSVQLGAGPGLSHALSAPDYRVFIGVGVEPAESEPDTDGDGFADSRDRCPRDPEDYDGFRDDDGCPEPDNDDDGIRDAEDACPLEPEDIDGDADTDGCPEPTLDTDGDGIEDVRDRCPREPEDADGFQDDDGCPDPDNDDDGVPDVRDRCPLEPGRGQADGCPAPAPKARAYRLPDSFRQAISFATNSFMIEETFGAQIEEVAREMQLHPEIELLSIEGHTDSRGSAAYNQRLSEARAAEVRAALVDYGVESRRLMTKGFGFRRPRGDNRSTEGRALNRRVELRVRRSRLAPSSQDETP